MNLLGVHVVRFRPNLAELETSCSIFPMSDKRKKRDLEENDEEHETSIKRSRTATDEAEQNHQENHQESTRPARVALREIRAGDLLSKTEFLQVLNVDQDKMTCKVLRGDKSDDLWEIETHEDLLACSSEYVRTEVKLCKTKLAERLMKCKDDIFKVVFRPVLKEQTLFSQLKAVHTELKEAKTDAELKKIAKKILEVPERTLRGRLIEGNTVLGYSKVDDLDQNKPGRPGLPEFRQVAHGNILALTTKGVRYVLG